MVDRSTVVAETAVDRRKREKVEFAQTRSAGYWILGGLALVLLAEQATFDFLLYNPILGDLAAEYKTSNIVWVMTTVLLAGAVLVPLFTKLADVYGKKRILAFVSVVTSLGCLVCALAPTFEVLLVGRALMAAGVVLAALCVLLIREVFPVRSRAVAIAVTMNGAGLIIVGGPLLSGWLVGRWGVSAPFWFQLVLCAVSAALALVVVPESPVRVVARVDYLGALLLGVGSFCLLIGLGQVPAIGWGTFTLGFTAAGIVLLLVWILQLNRSSEPLVNVKLLKRRALLTPTLSRALLNGTVISVNIIVVIMWSTPSSVASYGRDLTPLDIAVWSIPFAALTVGGGFLVGFTVRSIGYRTHMIVSGFLLTVVCILLAFDLQGSDGAMIAIYGLGGLGSMFLAAAASLVLLAAPEDQRGIANGVSLSAASIFSAVAQVLIFAILGNSVIAAVGGVAFYSEGAYRIALLTAGAIAVAGLITALFIPHGRRQPRREVASPAEEALSPAHTAQPPAPAEQA
ncbi:MAG TPA: MFS transporter [Amycolatopsis sp.]|uniref:MFS transporter n=1 Tax=Amycolatopsis sp. TaxID=37632 RepID=UPI002B47E559|nr:MFS transporter [Amycolatopsis sp.]HKS47010.1 MFS transporter [Amycolatopsis sp.]